MEKTSPVYKITKGNTDQSLFAGDRISFSPNGDLNYLDSRQGGWISKEDLVDSVTDFECEVDPEMEWVVTPHGQYARKK